MRVIIAGSRSVQDFKHLDNAVQQFEQTHGKITEVVSGCAEGADQMGLVFAQERNLPVHKFPADWKTHGKQAGMVRNVQMAYFADGLIALWDGKSPGTKHMIKQAQALKLPLVVYYVCGI